MLKRLISVEIIISGIFLSSVAMSHDLETDNTADRKTWNPDRLSHMPNDPVPNPAKSLGHPNLFYIVVLPNRWAQTQSISVCFNGGSQALRQKILQIAGSWFKYTNLRLAEASLTGLSCTNGDKSEVRIGFNEPGYWSYIGNDSVSADLISKNLSSMNFEGFDKNPPPEPRFSGIILHEWGHALGFHHEHQSPGEGCSSEYNWKKLYSYYYDNYGWDKKMVDNNLAQLKTDRSAYDWSKPDPKSIMIYGSDPRFLYRGTKSKCYFHDNNALSTTDIEGAARTYPKVNAPAMLKLQAATLSVVTDLKIEEPLLNALNRQHDLAIKQLGMEPN